MTTSSRSDVHARELEMPAAAGILSKLALAIPPVEKLAVAAVIADSETAVSRQHDPGVRTTQMGYEFRPQAVAATVRRAAKLLPGKPILVTEHGVPRRMTRNASSSSPTGCVHSTKSSPTASRSRATSTGAPSTTSSGHGYAMQFGLVAVDRETQERTIKPSARFLARSLGRTGCSCRSRATERGTTRLR